MVLKCWLKTKNMHFFPPIHHSLLAKSSGVISPSSEAANCVCHKKYLILETEPAHKQRFCYSLYKEETKMYKKNQFCNLECSLLSPDFFFPLFGQTMGVVIAQLLWSLSTSSSLRCLLVAPREQARPRCPLKRYIKINERAKRVLISLGNE